MTKIKKSTLIVGIVISILSGVFGSNGQTNTNDMVKVNSVDPFWLKRPIYVPENSMQYLLLPLPGGEGLDQVRNFKYVLDLAEGINHVSNVYMSGMTWFSEFNPIYPSLVKTIALDKNTVRYEFALAGIGTTVVKIQLSKYSLGPGITITGTGGKWMNFYGESPALANRSHMVRVLRRADDWGFQWGFTKHLSSCRGIVDVDDIIVRRKATGQIIFEEHFDDGSYGQFTGGQSNGISMEKEKSNYFVRISTTDAESKILQSIEAAGTNIPGFQSLVPGETCEITCRCRAKINRTPDNVVHMPFWFKIVDGRKEMEIKAHYEYDIGDKHYSGPEQVLRVMVVNDIKKPKMLETVLWSQAEDCMEWQVDQVQNYLLDITKSCGIKLHLTEIGQNPWKPPYDGKVKKMNLHNPLATKIKARGMGVIPFIKFIYWNQCFESYISNHPPTPGKLAINEIIDQFGQTNVLSSPDGGVCLNRLHEDGVYWPAILKMLKEGARCNKWDGLMWDYEIPRILCVPNKKSNRKSCFCPACIEAFKQYTGIKDITQVPENRVMLEKDYPFQNLAEPARSILSNYPLEWLKFKGDLAGRMCYEMIASVREVNPSARFYLYSGSYEPIPFAETPWRYCEYYGVYPPAIGKYVDVFMDLHFPMRGELWLPEIKLMREALKAGGNKKVPVLNTVSPTNCCYHLAKNDAIQSVALTEADGFQIYAWGSGFFDSQTWSSVREGITALTDFEDFFLEGARIDQVATLNKPLPYSVWIKGEDRVVFIFNNTAKDEKVTLKNDFRVKYASNRVTAKNHATGEVYIDPETIVCMAPAYDTTIIHFKAR
ncbi:MAG: hypothetical protein ABIH24_00020 [Verrucomicrobiota bacterium]